MQTLRSFIISATAVGFLLGTPAADGQDLSTLPSWHDEIHSPRESWAQNRRVQKRRKKRPTRKKERVQSNPVMSQNSPSPVAKETTTVEFALRGGWEGRYGNGVSVHYLPLSWLSLQGGVGYNYTGAKIGVGTDLLWPLSPALSLFAGLSGAVSSGTESKLNLSASFTPENGAEAENIVASKQYKITEAFYGTVAFGGRHQLMDGVLVGLELNYNKIVRGNDLTLDDGITYNQNIQLTNESEFNEAFKGKAVPYVTAGGFGGSLMFLIAL